MRFYWLSVGVLAVWRVTHLLNAEDGPWDLGVRLRQWAGRGAWGELLDCFHCLSLWVALPAALLIGEGWLERVLLWPALSAGAILLQAVLPRDTGLAAEYHEEPGVDDGLLREETGRVPGDDER